MTIEERIIEAYENIGTIAAAKRSYHPLTANNIKFLSKKSKTLLTTAREWGIIITTSSN